MTRLPAPLRIAALLFVAFLFSTPACSPGACVGACECRGVACACPSAGDCAVRCVEACDLQCAGSGACDFVCGPACRSACTGSGHCTVAVGEGSRVRCTGSGGCDVTCAGNCAVECPGSGICRARCGAGFECKIERCSGSLQTCADGTRVCHGACP